MPRVKADSKPSGDVAPKPKARRQPRKGNVTREMTDGLASFVAIPFAVLMPQQALQAVETQALSIALYDAAQANPWIKSIILSMTGFGGASELALVAGAIALPRVVGRMPDTPQTAQLKMFTFAGSQFIVQSVLEKDKHGKVEETPVPAQQAEPESSAVETEETAHPARTRKTRATEDEVPE
jgi:hypothetical protein